MLGQDEGFRKVIREFLDKHPELRLPGRQRRRQLRRLRLHPLCLQLLVQRRRGRHHCAIITPRCSSRPDKTSDIPDIWNPNDYNKATWRGLLCINFDMTGDTSDPAKLEGLRELVDIYHYLHRQGVVGRWVHVFRPLGRRGRSDACISSG